MSSSQKEIQSVIAASTFASGSSTLDNSPDIPELLLKNQLCFPLEDGAELKRLLLKVLSNVTES